VRKILKREIDKKLKKCGFNLENMFNEPIIRPYHCHEWDHGYYSWGGYEGSRREFYEDLREMVDFLYEYMNECNLEEVIIAPLHRYNIFAWSGNMNNDDRYSDIYDETMKLLKDNCIKKNSQSGIEITIKDNRKIIELILEGAYRYVIELCLFFSKNSVIIEPTHHFDLQFFTKDFKKQQEIIKKVTNKYHNIIYYEKFPPFD